MISKKKKIIWVQNTFRYSAIELLVKSLIKNNLFTNQFDLIIMVIDDKKFPPANDYIKYLKKKNVSFEIINYKTFFGFPRIKVIFQTFIKLKQINPDLVHIYCERYSFILAFFSRILGIPCIRTVCHIFDFGVGIISIIRRVSKIIQRYILRKINVLFLTNSDTNTKHESNYYLNPNANSVYCWFDPEEYNVLKKRIFATKNLNNSEKKIKLATLGGNWSYKNFDSILKAFKLIKDKRPDIYKEIEYIQVGADNDNLISLSKKLKVDNICIFLGNVKDWRTHLCNSDFLLAPSFEEGLNLAVVETSAFGLIPVLSKRKCLNEHIRLGGNVIWFDNIDPFSIYKKLLALYDYDYLNIDRIQKEISKKSFEHYSSVKLIPKLIGIYNLQIAKT